MYKIIYSDPPWPYSQRYGSGPLGETKVKSLPYPTMTIAAMKDLRSKIDEWALPDSALFMWVTSPFLGAGIELMDTWGFTYKTVAFTWLKTRGTTGGRHYNMGAYTMSSVEICLLGTRGSPVRWERNVKQVIEAPIGRHSAKPPETRDRIVQLFGDKPRIEMFARERVDGWDSWGNEV